MPGSRERYVVSPLSGLSERDRALARLAEPRSNVWPLLLTLLAVLVAALPAVLVGALAATVLSDLVGTIVSLLAVTVPAAATYRAASRPVRAARRGAKVRATLPASQVVDLHTPGLGPIRHLRIASASACVDSVRDAARLTGQDTMSFGVVETLERDAWRVAQLTSAAALVSPYSATDLDVEAEHALAALRECAGTAVAGWGRYQAALAGAPESPWLTGSLRLESEVVLDALERARTPLPSPERP